MLILVVFLNLWCICFITLLCDHFIVICSTYTVEVAPFVVFFSSLCFKKDLPTRRS